MNTTLVWRIPQPPLPQDSKLCNLDGGETQELS